MKQAKKALSELYNRVFHNWRTTLAGLLVFVFTVQLFAGKVDNMEYIALIGVIGTITGLFMKDPGAKASLILLCLLVGAGGCSRPPVSSNSEKSDSVRIEQRIRTEVLRVPGDTILFQRLIECDPISLLPRPIKAERKKPSGTVGVQVSPAGILTVSAQCDSLQKVVESLQESRVEVRTQKQRVEVPVPYTRTIDKICRVLAGLFLLSILLKLLTKLIP